MGSIGRAIKTGFVCRFCAKLKKFVIHLYVPRVKELNLANRGLLTALLNKYEGLPKAICEDCLKKVRWLHSYKMMRRIVRANTRFRPYTRYI